MKKEFINTCIHCKQNFETNYKNHENCFDCHEILYQINSLKTLIAIKNKRIKEYYKEIAKAIKRLVSAKNEIKQLTEKMKG